jgi:glycosyltransferase involved in cell wall biosynthesis
MSFKVECLVPCYQRPEYTSMCIKALEDAQEYSDTLFHLWDDGSKDGTDKILNNSKLNKRVVVNKENLGLRNVLINFLELTQSTTEFICVVGNDCLMPKNWMNDILYVFKNSDADILSPNVLPSNAAFKHGRDEGKLYRPSEIVGGLWFMKRKLIEGMDFTQYKTFGIKGAFEVLNQIILDKDPIVGWVPNVTVEDVGHWSGQHELHIKNEAHREYSANIGRRVSW